MPLFVLRGLRFESPVGIAADALAAAVAVSAVIVVRVDADTFARVDASCSVLPDGSA